MILGLAVELISLLRTRPLAFILFVELGCLLTFAGIVVYLYSLASSKALSA